MLIWIMVDVTHNLIKTALSAALKLKVTWNSWLFMLIYYDLWDTHHEVNYKYYIEWIKSNPAS